MKKGKKMFSVYCDKCRSVFPNYIDYAGHTCRGHMGRRIIGDSGDSENQKSLTKFRRLTRKKNKDDKS